MKRIAKIKVTIQGKKGKLEAYKSFNINDKSYNEYDVIKFLSKFRKHRK